jgi:hypothetical protein
MQDFWDIINRWNLWNLDIQGEEVENQKYTKYIQRRKIEGMNQFGL